MNDGIFFILFFNPFHFKIGRKREMGHDDKRVVCLSSFVYYTVKDEDERKRWNKLGGGKGERKKNGSYRTNLNV